MLYQSTVEPRTLSLLKSLMDLEELRDFALVGGTALALKFGHRVSVDNDLFTEQKFKIETITEKLNAYYSPDFINENPNVKFAVFCFIQSIKVDLVHYPHLLLKPIEIIDSIRMFSNEDIAAMKISAILGRGAKKDFYDVAALMKIFSLNKIIEFYNTKYPNSNLLISIPSAITYFEDAENGPDPISLTKITWEEVKNSIRKSVRDYLN